MAQQQNLETLRQREIAGEPLTEDERATLDNYYRLQDETEAELLRSAWERMDKRIAQQEATLSHLATLRDEKRQRLAHIRSLVREIEAIEAEETRVLSAVRE